MAKLDFIPASDIQFAAWHDKFKTAATSNQTEVKLPPEEVARIEAENEEIHSVLTATSLAAAAYRQEIARKKACISRIQANSRASAKRLKSHADYTPALGLFFGVEGPENSADLNHAKPKLTGVDHTDGQVEISFNKSKSHGIHLYCQRENDTDWVLLARISLSPYIDNRPLLQAGKPELRRYAAIYIYKDQEVGNYSDEIVVTCSP